ncbi:MAG: DUF4129 domain-containing protein [Acidimicrobiales bacterium]
MTSSHERRARTVQTLQIGLLAAMVMIALAVAASSDSVRVWTNPEPSDAERPAVVDSVTPTTPPAAEPTERSLPGGIGTLLEIVAIAAFALILLLGAYASSQLKTSFRAWRLALPGGRREAFAEPLPDAVDPQVHVDADAARVSLSEGPVRNAIVACWVQLEGDVAAAGLPRHVAETSSEYVERVIGTSSVDAEPIRELAALYREARFSIHDLGPDHRARAAQALDRALAALDHCDQAVA